MRRGLSLMLVVVLLGGVAACSGDDDASDAFPPKDGKNEPIDGTKDQTSVPRGEIKTYDGLKQDHVDHRVDYAQTPPVGGPHAGIWQNCGFYNKPIVTEAGVHSMEHGAVWITYRPDLPAAQIALIQAYAQQPYTLASPWLDGELPAPIVLSAWGAQVQVDELPLAVADEFLTTYRQSNEAPEPGAPCTGGTDFTE